ncbi:MAG: zinc ribbon domain-containing protein [Acidobacteria bacterium]|nr:zinc ribbon domain-containing protein [Acidobacteriota bacterium]
MIITITSLLTVGVLLYVLGVRAKDLPEAQPVSPFAHLDEKKAAIYDNLRDLQFEYRLGKLSEQDYQATKRDLQNELAGVMAEVDRLREKIASGAAVSPAPAVTRAQEPAKFVCPHCAAEFDQALKFCGECGKPMKVGQA